MPFSERRKEKYCMLIEKQEVNYLVSSFAPIAAAIIDNVVKDAMDIQ